MWDAKRRRIRCGEALTRHHGIVAKVRAELPKFAKNEAIEPDLSKSITEFVLSELESLVEQTETQRSLTPGSITSELHSMVGRPLIYPQSFRPRSG